MALWEVCEPERLVKWPRDLDDHGRLLSGCTSTWIRRPADENGIAGWLTPAMVSRGTPGGERHTCRTCVSSLER
jgi:hypothetical protein